MVFRHRNVDYGHKVQAPYQCRKTYRIRQLITEKKQIAYERKYGVTKLVEYFIELAKKQHDIDHKDSNCKPLGS